jgi:hypothetical protein
MQVTLKLRRTANAGLVASMHDRCFMTYRDALGRHPCGALSHDQKTGESLLEDIGDGLPRCPGCGCH